MSDKLNDLFADWTSSVPYEPIICSAQTQLPGEEIIINIPDQETAYYIGGMQVELQQDHIDFAAMRVIGKILGDNSQSSRLADRIRKQDGLSRDVNSYFWVDEPDGVGFLLVSAVSSLADSRRVANAVEEEIRRLVENGATDKEVADAKASYQKSIKVNRSTDGTLGHMLLECLLLNRDIDFYQRHDERIASLTTQQVNETLRRYYDLERWMVIRTGDFQSLQQEEAE